MTNKLTTEQRKALTANIVEALVELQDGNDGDLKARSYSGRAMYGASCLGVVGDAGPAQLQARLTELLFELDVRHDGEVDGNGERCYIAATLDLTATLRALCNVRSDSMGRGTVIYWPDLPAPESDESDPESGDEDEENDQ